MPTDPKSAEQRKKQRAETARLKQDTNETSEEVLQEQSKTETEERPYLDTEGGE